MIMINIIILHTRMNSGGEYISHESIQKLIQARQTVAEAEHIGLTITENLEIQGNQLKNIQQNVAKIDSNINFGRRIMYKMRKYEWRYTALYLFLILVILIIIAVLIYIIYKKTT